MTVYHYLLALDEAGYLKHLICAGVISSHLVQWMEICAYHLDHPELSQWQVALHFNTSKRKVWNAYKLLEEAPGTR